MSLSLISFPVAGIASAKYGSVPSLFAREYPTKTTSEMKTQTPRDGEMIVRISEIEVYPEFLDEYLKFALTVGEVSVREEEGVIAIFPMLQQRDSCQFRILEIYADTAAYKHHIATRHFQTYKQGTLHMVKKLDLVDMYPLNPEAMPAVFRKMKAEDGR